LSSSAMSYKNDNYENPFDPFSDDLHLLFCRNKEFSLEEHLESLGEGKE